MYIQYYYSFNPQNKSKILRGLSDHVCMVFYLTYTYGVRVRVMVFKYLPPNVVVNRTCSMKYGSELIWIFSNISVPQCDDYFMLVPDLLQTQGVMVL
jgi:hypothetical protein